MDTIRKDSEWSVVDGEPCKIIRFNPLASIKNGKVIVSNKTEPYASVLFECKSFDQQVEGFICHKIDFQHLWSAFNERGVRKNEEVIIFFNKKRLRSFAKLFSSFMPGLHVMICLKGAYELMANPESRPELQGEARFLAERPIVEWKPTE